MALFAATVVLSHRFQRRRDGQLVDVPRGVEDGEEEVESEDSDDIVDLREVYMERRRSARLSFGDLAHFKANHRLSHVTAPSDMLPRPKNKEVTGKICSCFW